MGSSIYLTPRDGDFDLTALLARIKARHRWALVLPSAASNERFHGSFFDGPVERRDAQDGYDITKEGRVEHRQPAFGLGDRLVWVGANWSDTRQHDARRFLTFTLSRHPCTAQDHDGYSYTTTPQILRWIDMFLPLR